MSESVKLGQDVKSSITKARDDTMWTGCTSLVFTPSLLTLSNHTITALKGEPAISDGQNWKIVSIIIYSSRPVQNCPWIPRTPHNLSMKFAPISHICVNNEIFNLPAQKIGQFLGKMPKINVVSVFLLHLDSLVIDIRIRVRMVAILRRRWYNVTWYHDAGLLKRSRIFYLWCNLNP